MSAAKIELEFGAKYSAAQKFQQMSSDLKSAGKEMKDFGGAAKSVANELAGAFGGKLSVALNSTLSVFNEMAKGGIWGLVQASCNAAISFVANKFQEAQAAASKFADICRDRIVDGMKAVGERFGDVSKSIDESTAKAKDMLAVLNGEVAAKAELKVHELNVAALQSITDDMSAATKAAVMATAQLEQAEVKAAAAVEQAANATANAQAGTDAARQKREAAEQALADAQAQRAEFEQKAAAYGNGWLAQYQELQGRASQTTEQLMAAGLTLEQALQFRKGAALSLAETEEQHKNEISALNEVTKLETAAKVAVEAAKRGEETATNALAIATQKEEVARAAAADTVEQARVKQVEAQAAADKERLAKEAAAAEEEKLAAKYDMLSKIATVCFNNKVDDAAYTELYTKMLEGGYSEGTITIMLQKKLNEELEARAKQLKEERETAKKSGTSGASSASVKDLAEAIKQGIGGATVNVNTGGIGDGVDKSDKVITLGSLQRDVRDEQRKARDHLDNVKKSSAAMQAYLKGKMSPEVAKAFEQKIKANGMTLKDFKTMTKDALKAQLLTHSQAVEQQKAIIKMEKALTKLGLK